MTETGLCAEALAARAAFDAADPYGTWHGGHSWGWVATSTEDIVAALLAAGWTPPPLSRSAPSITGRN